MLVRSTASYTLIMLAMLLLVTPARAGGWAVVTLDTLPTEVRAGQPLQLGFMLLQHGVHPTDGAWESEGQAPILSAANQATGASLMVESRKEGPVGHFVVDVSFPSAGAWSWEIAPLPFQATTFEPLAVLPPLAAAPGDAVGVALASQSPRWSLRLAGAGLLLLAAALALAGRRAAPSRPLIHRSH